MPTFVVRYHHTPDQCPTSNGRIREIVRTRGRELPRVAERLGVTIAGGPWVLAEEHDNVLVVHAERVEQVSALLLESGLAQWNTARISLARSLDELLTTLASTPPPLH